MTVIQVFDNDEFPLSRFIRFLGVVAQVLPVFAILLYQSKYGPSLSLGWVPRVLHRAVDGTAGDPSFAASPLGLLN